LIIVITGAGGWLGRNISKALAGTHEIREVVRTRRNDSQFGWDCGKDDSTGLISALTGASVIIHCAAHVHRPNETPNEQELFHQINVLGTRKLLEACQKTGVSRLVLISSVAVYPFSEDMAYGENSPTGPQTAYGRSKLEAERITSASSLDWRIIRLATVFGSEDRANFYRLARALKRRRFVIPGMGRGRKSLISINKASTVIASLAMKAETKHRIVNVAAPEAPDLLEICSAFQGLCGFPKPPRVPLGFLRAGAMVGDRLASLYSKFPLTSKTVEKLSRSTIVSTQRLAEELPSVEWQSFRDELRGHTSYYRAL
jgi:nucleoside-diphosphate-sugar epimerase